jgi:acetyl esterase/lipase
MSNILFDCYWKYISNSDTKRKAAQSAPEGIVGRYDFNYAGDDDQNHMLDIYYPKDAQGKLPLILDIHGGGWYYGDRKLNEFYCMWLAKQGFAVASLSYTLCAKATVYRQIQECFQALEYLYNNADELDIDKNNFFVTGDSAGGHLAAMVTNASFSQTLAKALDVKPIVKPRAVCFTCPSLETAARSVSHSFMKLYFNAVLGKDYAKDDKYKNMDFSANLSDDMCPAFFISAYGDFLANETRQGYELVKSRGIDAQLCLYEKQQIKGHKLGHVFNVLYPHWEEAQQANTAMCDFFKKYIVK